MSPVSPSRRTGAPSKRPTNRPASARRSIADLPGPPGWPVLGNYRELDAARFHRIVEDWAAEYGDLFVFRLGPKPIVVISDPELASEVMRRRPDTFSRRSRLAQIIDEMGATGVLTAEGDRWRRLRRLSMRALDTRHQRSFFPALATITQRLRRRLAAQAAAGQSIEIQKDLMRYTVDVTTSLAFGYEMNTLEQGDDVIQQHLEKVFPMVAKRVVLPFPIWRYLKRKDDRELERALTEIRKTVDHFIQSTRQLIAAEPQRAEHPSNMLEVMLAARDEDGSSFSDDDLFGNVFTMLQAGEDTTANTLAWITYFLSTHPEVSARLQRAVDDVLGHADGIVSIEQAAELPYLDGVALETMRLKPVVPLSGHEALVDVELGDLRLPAGTWLYTAARPPAMSPTIYPEPRAFRPERWLEPGFARRKEVQESFVPFGFGPRICPGRSLAMLEIRMVVAMLLRHFRICPRGPSEEVTETFSLAMTPTDLHVRLQARTDAAPRG